MALSKVITKGIVVAGGAAPPSGIQRIYVDGDAAGGGDGTTWDTAFNNFAAAQAAALALLRQEPTALDLAILVAGNFIAHGEQRLILDVPLYGTSAVYVAHPKTAPGRTLGANLWTLVFGPYAIPAGAWNAEVPAPAHGLQRVDVVGAILGGVTPGDIFELRNAAGDNSIATYTVVKVKKVGGQDTVWLTMPLTGGVFGFPAWANAGGAEARFYRGSTVFAGGPARNIVLINGNPNAALPVGGVVDLTARFSGVFGLSGCDLQFTGNMTTCGGTDSGYIALNNTSYHTGFFASYGADAIGMPTALAVEFGLLAGNGTTNKLAILGNQTVDFTGTNCETSSFTGISTGTLTWSGGANNRAYCSGLATFAGRGDGASKAELCIATGSGAAAVLAASEEACVTIQNVNFEAVGMVAPQAWIEARSGTCLISDSVDGAYPTIASGEAVIQALRGVAAEYNGLVRAAAGVGWDGTSTTPILASQNQIYASTGGQVVAEGGPGVNIYIGDTFGCQADILAERGGLMYLNLNVEKRTLNAANPNPCLIEAQFGSKILIQDLMLLYPINGIPDWTGAGGYGVTGAIHVADVSSLFVFNGMQQSGVGAPANTVVYVKRQSTLIANLASAVPIAGAAALVLGGNVAGVVPNVPGTLVNDTAAVTCENCIISDVTTP
jgi:hypothetical protein